MIINVCLVILVISAILCVELKDLLSSVIVLAIFSLVLSLAFYLYQAPDVAIAEAAVGAGVGTTLFILVLSKIKRENDRLNL